jgi:hypothetical protein
LNAGCIGFPPEAQARVQATEKAMLEATHGAGEAILMGAALNILERLVISATPEGRPMLLRTIRVVTDLIEVNAQRTGH